MQTRSFRSYTANPARRRTKRRRASKRRTKKTARRSVRWLLKTKRYHDGRVRHARIEYVARRGFSEDRSNARTFASSKAALDHARKIVGRLPASVPWLKAERV